jgi:RNA polymerase sigma factor (TIGR02999 family)
MSELTLLMQRANDGDVAARDAIFALLYEDFRKLAHLRLARGSRNTLLDTTAVVHEVYLRLAGSGGLQPEDRNHYLAYASRVMRSVIVDFARARSSARRGGDVAHVTLNTEIGESTASAEAQILSVHEALEALAAVDERAVQVVEMKYFAGLTNAEVSAALGVTERTVGRDWEKARFLLAAALR